MSLLPHLQPFPRHPSLSPWSLAQFISNLLKWRLRLPSLCEENLLCKYMSDRMKTGWEPQLWMHFLFVPRT